MNACSLCAKSIWAYFVLPNDIYGIIDYITEPLVCVPQPEMGIVSK